MEHEEEDQDQDQDQGAQERERTARIPHNAKSLWGILASYPWEQPCTKKLELSPQFPRILLVRAKREHRNSDSGILPVTKFILNSFSSSASSPVIDHAFWGKAIWFASNILSRIILAVLACLIADVAVLVKTKQTSSSCLSRLHKFFDLRRQLSGEMLMTSKFNLDWFAMTHISRSCPYPLWNVESSYFLKLTQIVIIACSRCYHNWDTLQLVYQPLKVDELGAVGNSIFDHFVSFVNRE